MKRDKDLEDLDNIEFVNPEQAEIDYVEWSKKVRACIKINNPVQAETRTGHIV